jgi:hypothetical protein
MRYVLYGSGYVTVAAEYEQDILMKIRLNISDLQNRRTFEYEEERDKLENLVINSVINFIAISKARSFYAAGGIDSTILSIEPSCGFGYFLTYHVQTVGS